MKTINNNTKQAERYINATIEAACMIFKTHTKNPAHARQEPIMSAE